MENSPANESSQAERAIADRLTEMRKEIAADPSRALCLSPEIEALRNWSQLEAEHRPKSTPGRWKLVLLFFLTLMLTSIVFFRHMPTSRIDIDAEVSEVSFVIDQNYTFPFPQPLKSFALTGALAIDEKRLSKLASA